MFENSWADVISVTVKLRPMTIQPVTVPAKFPRSGGDGNDGVDLDEFGYKYYLSMPMSEEIDGKKLLNSQVGVTRLMNLLRHSEPRPEVKEVLQQGQETQCLPVTASALSAMTLGFFAYDPSGSGELLLLTINTKKLTVCDAPIHHPLCAFWLASVESLCKSIDINEAVVTVSKYQMTVHETGSYEPHVEVIRQAQCLGLKAQKRELEQDLVDLEMEAVSKKSCLQSVKAKLLELQKPGLGAAKDSESHAFEPES